MGFGVSLFLITLGAIFKWAIKAHINGLDLPNLGLILMAVGAAAFVLQLILLLRRPNDPDPEIFHDERGRPPQP